MNELVDGEIVESEQEVGSEASSDLEPLGLLQEMTTSELRNQQMHVEALDTKAGIILGLAGAIVALWARSTAATLGAVLVPTMLAIIFGGLSALMALYTFWPRNFQVLDVERIRNQALDPVAAGGLRLALLDTRIELVNVNSAILASKARRLKTSMTFLLLSILLLGVSFLVVGLARW